MVLSPRPPWFNKVLRCLPAVLWAVFIFVMSSQNASASSANSQGIVRPVVAFVAEVTQLPALSSDTPGYELLLDDIGSVFREAAHSAEYLVLGALMVLASTAFSLRRRAWVAFAVCVAYSLTDETHQLFVPGRAFQLQDLALDALGSALGVWTVTAAMNVSARRSQRAKGAAKVCAEVSA